MNKIDALIYGKEFSNILNYEMADNEGFFIKKDILEEYIKKDYPNLELAAAEAGINRLKDFLNCLETSYYYINVLLPTIEAIKFILTRVHTTNYIKYLKENNHYLHYTDLECIYSRLRSYNKEFQIAIFNNANIDFALSSKLLRSLKKDEFEIFEDCIIQYKIDITPIKELCESHDGFLFGIIGQALCSPLLKEFNNRKSKDELGFIVNSLGLKFNVCNYAKFNTDYDFNNPEELMKFLTEFSTFIREFSHYICIYLAAIITSFPLLDEEEIQLIKNKLSNSISEKYNSYFLQLHSFFYNYELDEKYITVSIAEHIKEAVQFVDELTHVKTIENANISKFHISSDLFEPNKYVTYHKKDEFFVLRHDLKISKSPEILSNLINELADWGYISNDSETKSLFAYRLTGKKILRPKELKPIQWNEQSRSKRGYSLLYLIKKLTNSNETGTYNKVKEFFIGPEWGKKLNQDANNKNGTIPFKRLLHEISPDDFPDPK